jgi:hypothetical protein
MNIWRGGLRAEALPPNPLRRALKKAKSRWEGFNNPPKSPFRKGGLKRICLIYQVVFL